MGIRRISLEIGWISITVGLAVSNAAADSASISVPLQRTGADTNASGLVTISLGATNSSLLLQVTNLAPGRTYTVTCGGLLRGTFVANPNGRAQLRFSQPFTPGTLKFNFDPRGRQFVIMRGTTPVLRARISAPDEPRGSIVNEQVTLPRVPAAVGGAANARYELLADGTRRFSVTLTNVRDGTWRMYVDGIRRRNIIVSGGSGRIALDNAAATPEPALNFDPRGVVIDIARTNILRFSGKFQARAAGINAATPSVQTYFIPPVAASTNSFARGRRSVDRDARRKFDVELGNLPVGDYELYVNGAFQGMIPVLAGSAGTEGEMQFASEPDDEEELPLNFNAVTSSYSIQQAGVVLFEGQPVASDSGDTNIMMPVRLVLPLFNLGVDANGIARAQFKRDERGSRHFEVLLKNVPADYYFLTVNGVPVAIVWVTTVENGTRGVVEFEDEPELGELPLTFDPLGKVIGIERRRVRYFERVFPANP